VEREYIRGQCVDFVVGERLRLRPRHGPPGEIENGRGIGPIVADQLCRVAVGAVERTAADQRAARSTTALLAMAERAGTLGVDQSTLRGCPAARRHTHPAGP